jgi:hypothetical protein
MNPQVSTLADSRRRNCWRGCRPTLAAAAVDVAARTELRSAMTVRYLQSRTGTRRKPPIVRSLQ